MPNILQFGAYTTLTGVGAKILTQMKVRDYLLGYEDDIFTMLGSLHTIFGSDSKKLPKQFGVLQKV